MDNVTNSPISFKDDFFTIHVTVESPTSLPIGASTQFTIPGYFYDFITSFPLLSTDGQHVATVTGDPTTNLFTITFDGTWGSTHTNIVGTFTFNARLSYVLGLSKRALDTVTLVYPLVLPAIFTTPQRQFESFLIFENPSSVPNPLSGQTGPTPLGDIFVFSGTPISTTSSGGPGITLTSTATSLSTTIVTITSCSHHVCSTTTSAALQSIATTTVNGVETVYTTYCPLPETTVIVTVTSCSEHVCTLVTSPAIESVVTTVLNGVSVVYTTFCPISSAAKPVYTTVVNGVTTALNPYVVTEGKTTYTAPAYTTVIGGTTYTVPGYATVVGGTVTVAPAHPIIVGGTTSTVSEYVTVVAGTTSTVPAHATVVGGTTVLSESTNPPQPAVQTTLTVSAFNNAGSSIALNIVLFFASFIFAMV